MKKQGDVVGAVHQQHEAERDRNRRQKRNEQQILRDERLVQPDQGNIMATRPEES